MSDLRVPGVLDDPHALVRLVLDGNEAAFARIVRLHRSAMVRACFVVTLEEDGALEAVGAAWPVAWDRLQYLPDPARLQPWLCAIAAREARDVVDHGLTRLDLGDPSNIVAPAARPDATALDRDPDLARALAGLSVGDRVLLALRHVAGLTPAELGRATLTAPASVEGRLSTLGSHLAGGFEEQLGARLRAFADIPVGFVRIDNVARNAKVTHGDGRLRLASLALAAVLAAPFLAIPYLGESGAWPALFDNLPTPPPAPALDAPPVDPAPPR